MPMASVIAKLKLHCYRIGWNEPPTPAAAVKRWGLRFALHSASPRKRMGSGDPPGLQNRRAAPLVSPVRSTRTRFRHFVFERMRAAPHRELSFPRLRSLPPACNIEPHSLYGNPSVSSFAG